MNISKLSKAKVLATLYNGSKVQGMGFLQARQGLMNESEAEELLKDQKDFDYLFGKVMKIDLSSDELDTRLYNRDNGEGKAERLLSELV